MSSKIHVLHVEFMPKTLEVGILYVSIRFNVAAHICPCGCGSKIVTPLGPYEWIFTEKKGVPTLFPSIGNWQIPCRSHYWIKKGHIEWSYTWTEEEIKAGRIMEQSKLEVYYQNKYFKKASLFKQLKNWILKKL